MVIKQASTLTTELRLRVLGSVLVEVHLGTLSKSIEQTVRDFRMGSTEWETEVRCLFEEVDRFLAAQNPSDGESKSAAIVADVADLKGLVEQQTEVLTALVNALTGTTMATEPPDVPEHPTTDDIDPFERLQQAVAAATESS
jgi:hypothetical protein